MRLAIIAICLFAFGRAEAHSIYTNLHGRDHQWCCNGDENGITGDCAPAMAKAVRNGVEFKVRGKEWVWIPSDRVTFLPVPGEDTLELGLPAEGTIWGHFCGRPANETDRINDPQNVFGSYYFYCGFYDPTGV